MAKYGTVPDIAPGYLTELARQRGATEREDKRLAAIAAARPGFLERVAEAGLGQVFKGAVGLGVARAKEEFPGAVQQRKMAGLAIESAEMDLQKAKEKRDFEHYKQDELVRYKGAEKAEQQARMARLEAAKNLAMAGKVSKDFAREELGLPMAEEPGVQVGERGLGIAGSWPLMGFKPPEAGPPEMQAPPISVGVPEGPSSPGVAPSITDFTYFDDPARPGREVSPEEQAARGLVQPELGRKPSVPVEEMAPPPSITGRYEEARAELPEPTPSARARVERPTPQKMVEEAIAEAARIGAGAETVLAEAGKTTKRQDTLKALAKSTVAAEQAKLRADRKMAQLEYTKKFIDVGKTMADTIKANTPTKTAKRHLPFIVRLDKAIEIIRAGGDPTQMIQAAGRAMRSVSGVKPMGKDFNKWFKQYAEQYDHVFLALQAKYGTYEQVREKLRAGGPDVQEVLRDLHEGGAKIGKLQIMIAGEVFRKDLEDRSWNQRRLLTEGDKIAKELRERDWSIQTEQDRRDFAVKMKKWEAGLQGRADALRASEDKKDKADLKVLEHKLKVIRDSRVRVYEQHGIQLVLTETKAPKDATTKINNAVKTYENGMKDLRAEEGESQYTDSPTQTPLQDPDTKVKTTPQKGSRSPARATPGSAMRPVKTVTDKYNIINKHKNIMVDFNGKRVKLGAIYRKEAGRTSPNTATLSLWRKYARRFGYDQHGRRRNK